MSDSIGNSNGLPFLKMHGCGNDFVVIDARCETYEISEDLAKAVGDRHFGVGFDQLALIETDPEAEAKLTFFNADGSLSATCGNATRCIAKMILDEQSADQITLRTERGLLPCKLRSDGMASVNMGQPIFAWQDIPLAKDVDTLNLPIDGTPSAVGLGNPHMSFVVDDAEAVDLLALGQEMEHHPLYPQRTNVEVLSLSGENEIRMRIWERGVGITLASGSGSCAAAITAARKGLTGKTVTVHVDGGTLLIEWMEDGVWMSGPTATVFEGLLTPEFLAGL